MTVASKIVPTGQRTFEELIGHKASTSGPFTQEELNEADRISNGIWNTTIRKYHEEVADDVFASLLIYHTILHQSAIQLTELFDDNHYVEQLAEIYEVCDWDAHTEQALEFFYIGGEIEEYLEDETEEENIEFAVWFDLGMSCLYETVSHLMMIKGEEEDPIQRQNLELVIDAYKELGVIALEMFDHHSDL